MAAGAWLVIDSLEGGSRQVVDYNRSYWDWDSDGNRKLARSCDIAFGSAGLFSCLADAL